MAKEKHKNKMSEPDIEDSSSNSSKAKGKKDKGSKLKIQSCQAFSPIQDISDGIIITKDRRFIKILEVTPINFLLRSIDEQVSIIQSFASVLKAMPVKTQFKVVSRTSDVSGFVEKIQADMETEENANCRQLQKEQIELIANVGAREGVSRRFFIIFAYEEPSGFKKSPTFNEIKATLNQITGRIRGGLVRCGNELISLDEDKDMLKVLYTILCKAESERSSFDVRMYETVSRYLADENYDPNKDSYIPINDFIMPKVIDTRESAKFITIDGIYYSFAYIPSRAYSTTAVGGWLSLLVNLGEGVDVDLFVRKEPLSTVQTKLQYALRFNKVKARGMEDTSTEYDDVRSAIDSGYYLKQGIANGEDFCYMGILLTITAYSQKELEWKLNEVKMFLLSQDLRMKLCWFEQEQALLMSMPLCRFDEKIFKKCRRNILTSSLASTYPFVSFEINDENGILFGMNKANNSLVFVDNFDSRTYKNANMAILGTSGSGKTYTLQCMALRMRERKTQVFIIAPYKGHEFKRACEGIGGQYVKIAAGSNQNINIMEIRKRNTEITELLDGEDAVQDSILASKIQQLHTF
ncbi:MAG: PrgI family protein, partial [bacterium]|nr:PrgI family protein [bacterium]